MKSELGRWDTLKCFRQGAIYVNTIAKTASRRAFCWQELKAKELQRTKRLELCEGLLAEAWPPLLQVLAAFPQAQRQPWPPRRSCFQAPPAT